jgi:hypothetical protein
VSLRLASPTVTRFANPRRAATLTITSDDTDRVAPAVHVLSRWLRLRRPVRVPLSCSEACRATVELRVTRRQAKRLKVPVRVARATVRTAKAGRATARLVVARRTLARLRRARRVPMTVRIAATDGAGNRRVAPRRVVARR